jgi:hypothetical protein
LPEEHIRRRIVAFLQDRRRHLGGFTVANLHVDPSLGPEALYQRPYQVLVST